MARLPCILHILLELIEMHSARVKSVVPPDELLAMSMKEGCGTLVRFRGKRLQRSPAFA